jgi:hypothetical protein
MKIATIFDYLEPNTVSRLKKHHRKYTEWVTNTIDEALKNPLNFINATALCFSIDNEKDNRVKTVINTIGEPSFLIKAQHLNTHYFSGKGYQDGGDCSVEKPCELCRPPVGWQPTLTNTTQLAVYPIGRVGNDWIFSVWTHSLAVPKSLAEAVERQREADLLIRGYHDVNDYKFLESYRRWLYQGAIQISPLGWHCDTALMKLISTTEKAPINHHGMVPQIDNRTKYLIEKRLFLPFLLLKRCFEIIEPRTKNKTFVKLHKVFSVFCKTSEHERQAHTAFRWILPSTIINGEPVYGQRFNHKGNLVVKVRRPIKASTVKRQLTKHLNPQRTA